MWIYYERVTYVDESVSPTAAHILFCKAIRSSNQPRWRSVDCNRSLSCSSAAAYVYGLHAKFVVISCFNERTQKKPGGNSAWR